MVIASSRLCADVASEEAGSRDADRAESLAGRTPEESFVELAAEIPDEAYLRWRSKMGTMPKRPRDILKEPVSREAV